MISFIIFSIVKMRPYIAFATSVKNRFAKQPSHQYTKIVKTISILQKLKTAKDYLRWLKRAIVRRIFRF